MTLTQAFSAVAAAMIAADPSTPLTRGQATDILQVEAPTLRNSEGNAFWDALAVMYEALGLTNNPTYGQLRGEVIREGQAVAEDLFDALLARINSFPETAPIQRALELADLLDQQGRLPANIAAVESVIAATTDSQLIDAYNQSLNALQALETQLADRLAALN